MIFIGLSVLLSIIFDLAIVIVIKSIMRQINQNEEMVQINGSKKCKIKTTQ